MLIALLVSAWPLSGMLIHWLTYCRRTGDYHPLGFVLALLPGPLIFAVWLIYREDHR